VRLCLRHHSRSSLSEGYSSIDAVLDEYKGEWAAISGVDEIGTVINQSGYFEEIDIIVTAPSEIQSIREIISESVQAVPEPSFYQAQQPDFGSGLVHVWSQYILERRRADRQLPPHPQVPSEFSWHKAFDG
jgi:hypothetical protein